MPKRKKVDSGQRAAAAPEFKVPEARAGGGQPAAAQDEIAGIAIEDGQPIPGTDEHAVTIQPLEAGRVLPPASPIAEVLLEAIPSGRCARRIHLDRRLSIQAADGAGRLRESLRVNLPDAKLANDRYVGRDSNGPAVQWLLEQLGDPRIKRIVFLTE